MKKLKDPKIFSLEDAKETLPFVKRIVGDIVHTHKELQKLNHSIRLTKNLKKRRSKIFQREQFKQSLKEFRQELNLVGCHLKNPSQGIIGYYWNPGNGAVVELCWKYGEDEISYWQEIGRNKMRPLKKFPFQHS